MNELYPGLAIPAVLGSHASEGLSSLTPWAISLSLDGVNYSTNGNGFIAPDCLITVTKAGDNSGGLVLASRLKPYTPRFVALEQKT